MKTAKYVEQNGIEIGDENSEIHYVPNADIISLETMVHMIVNKGICTAEELFMLEGHVQELNQKSKKNSFVDIQSYRDRGRFPGLKKIMSKHRWSRRLGSFLFGWKWKRIKKTGAI